jgi:hypothetical protein
MSTMLTCLTSYCLAAHIAPARACVLYGRRQCAGIKTMEEAMAAYIECAPMMPPFTAPTQLHCCGVSVHVSQQDLLCGESGHTNHLFCHTCSQVSL